jgi:hypothetical protein
LEITKLANYFQSRTDVTQIAAKFESNLTTFISGVAQTHRLQDLMLTKSGKIFASPDSIKN